MLTCTRYIGETESLRNPMIEFCPVHDAAFRMYAALEKLSKGNRSPGVLEIAREAIKGIR